MTNLSCAMALYRSGWIWLAVGLFGCCARDTGVSPAAANPGSIPHRSASATVPNVITTQNSQSTENRPVHVSFTQHLKVEPTGMEGHAQESATYHWSKQTKNIIASDPLSFHGNNESKSTNVLDPLSFNGNNESKSTNVLDPLSFNGNNESKSTNVLDPLSFHGNNESKSTHVLDPLSFNGNNESKSTNVLDPLSFNGNNESKSTHVLDPLSFNGNNESKSTNVLDPLSFNGNNESKSTNVLDPLSFHGNNESKSTNVLDPLSFNGNNESKSTNVPDPLSFNGNNESKSTNVLDPLSFNGNNESKSTNVLDPLSFNGNNESKSTNVLDPLSFNGNNESKSTNVLDPLSFNGNNESKSTNATDEEPCDSNITTINDRNPYRWNKTKMSAEDFLLGFKPYVCWYGQIISHLCTTNFNPFPCRHDPGCETYSTCCADNATDLVTASYTACTRSEWYVLAKCPAGWAGNDTVRVRCEEGVDGYPDENLVSDRDSGVAYRNEWCALCHNVTHVTRWAVEVKCTYYQEVYSALTQRELLRLAVDHPEHCSVGSSPPRGVQPRRCNSRLWPESRVVGTCNATGQWHAERYDRDVAVNCRRYKALILRVSFEVSESSVVVYQNLFCAICNDELPVCVSSERNMPLGIRPFSLLLGLLDRDVHWGEQADRDCLPGQWLDHKNECQNLTCVAGKVLKNDSCVTALDEIRGLAYYVNLTLRPFQPLYVSRSNVSVFCAKLEQKVNEKLKVLVNKFNLSICIDTARCSPSSNLEQVLRVRITGDVHAKRYERRDDVEVSLVHALFHKQWDVVLNNTRVCLAQSKAYNPDRARIITSRILKMGYIALEYRYTMENTSFARSLLVTLTPVLTCPFLEFKQSQYDLRPADDRGNDARLLLTSLTGETEVPDLRQTWLAGGSLYVCYDALKSLRRPARGSAGLDWQYVLTMLVMPLSMLCLLLTLAVYCLLPALRTQPGLNTMCTCLSLLLAQLSLLVAAHAQGTTARPWCQVLGAVVHAAWLNVFCWTSICSVHMFRAFSAQTYHHGSLSTWRPVIKTAGNIGISVLVPAAVTGLVMGVSHLLTDGRSLGYSDVSCFLDSTLVVGLAMVLPASLLLSLNLTLFVLTVRRIHQVTRLRLQSEEAREAQRHVYACARLSLLTGMTWVVSLVAEGLNVDWLQLISIVVNGGQGILLLLSHLSTRRIAAMLVVKVGRKGQESCSSLQSTNTGLHSGNK